MRDSYYLQEDEDHALVETMRMDLWAGVGIDRISFSNPNELGEAEWRIIDSYQRIDSIWKWK